MKASVTAVKRALKPFLLLLICSVCLWFIYTQYNAFESHKLKIYVTTTPHQPIAESNLNNATQSKNESHYEINEENILERKENVQMGIESKATNMKINTTQNTTKIQPNFSSNQPKIEEQKPNRMIQVHVDDTTIKNDIDNDAKVKCAFSKYSKYSIRLNFLGSKSTSLL